MSTDRPQIARIGTVTFYGGKIFVHDDWQFDNCSCREGARLAAMHVLIELSRHLQNDFLVDKPSIVIGNPDDFFSDDDEEGAD